MSNSYIRLGRLSQFESSTRHAISLRSWTDPSNFRDLLLFHFADLPPSRQGRDDDVGVKEGEKEKARRREWYCMESNCPHLGAPLEEADVEIEDLVIVCPWHSYDFSLSTGESSTGLMACTFQVDIRREGPDDFLWLETPDKDPEWRVISIRPVPEKFADSSDPAPITDPSAGLGDPQEPRSLTDWACRILNTPDPDLKCQLTKHAVHLFRTGQLPTIGSTLPPTEPPRHSSLKTVSPHSVKSRGKSLSSEKSRIQLFHSLASIEQWAVDLAWDIQARFADWGGKRMPLGFFSDFCKMAEDEAKHFTLLRQRIEALGSHFGALPIHSGLWSSALETSHSLISRLCIIHLVHEARGLDVNPTQIAKVKAIGDHESVESLTIIHQDEVTHVATGHRWLVHLCQNPRAPMTSPEDPVKVFRSEVQKHFFGKLKAPFNVEDRARAGMSKDWYEELEGRGGVEGAGGREGGSGKVSELAKAVEGVKLGV